MTARPDPFRIRVAGRVLADTGVAALCNRLAGLEGLEPDPEEGRL